jgi:hippurate hydrolase
MASMADFKVKISGKDWHATLSLTAVGSIVEGAAIVQPLRTSKSRSADPVAALVVIVTKFHVRHALNIILKAAEFAGTVQTLNPKLTKHAIMRIFLGLRRWGGRRWRVREDRF